ncbi:23S rRNA (guanine(745)-N(1))-methyltransferase [Photobacterium toruni]|uniref:23S rRNA (Guanine(745)-N(1))-methyltransferase n=1 Tax=Photobacterium toruni TaxID=1935446 RepID=A0ABU6L5I3_9GAMM|nr:23S rRNA (guanine(745)-N(1))-methyltransferase [Photobacterium toruni]MEC6815398.1 23S rRNA (guanine(745)-N(1))-methyltransferase [Photobacterium toruni]MEC6831817.1 23S rRNA (guanine(745)-N(1))-methyltransferase [Photobacterium toruni]
MSYQCPLCHLPLIMNANNASSTSYRCSNNHQFDQAKEGYVNLMPVHHKSSKNPGDNKEMMQARRLFLNTDHYQPLRNAVMAQLRHYLPTDATELLDIGCGEGYYTSEFVQLRQQFPDITIHGLDISKVAVKYAAKRYHDCDFCVASSHRLPFADHFLDGVVRIYAPCKGEELNRAIKSGGILVAVTPAPRHLYQLKELIYNGVNLHDVPVENIEGFELVADEQLHYDMTLSGEEATALMQMTPFAWKTSEQVWQQLAQAQNFGCEADFAIRVYRRS